MVANQPLKKTQMTIHTISSKNQLTPDCEHNMNHNDLWLDWCVPHHDTTTEHLDVKCQ